MEIHGAPALPYNRLDLHYLLSLFPIRDRIFRLIFPYDIHALDQALVLHLSAEDTDYYSRFWYDDAGVSFVSRSSSASLASTMSSHPYYYGLDLLTELPKAVVAWLDTSGCDASQPFYSRLNIEGQASVGSISFIIEARGSCFDFSFMTVTRPWTSLRVWLSNDSKYETAETKTFTWIVSDPGSQEQAVKEILGELKNVLQYMYGQKTHGLFPRDNKEMANSRYG